MKMYIFLITLTNTISFYVYILFPFMAEYPCVMLCSGPLNSASYIENQMFKWIVIYAVLQENKNKKHEE